MTGTGALGRALAVLEGVVDAELSGSGLPIAAQLGRRLDLDPAQLSRVLKALRDAELIEYDEPSRSYRVGTGYLRLASRVDGRGIIERGRPLLRALVASFELPTWIAVQHGTAALTVASEHDNWTDAIVTRLGKRTPLWCTGVGRALLLDYTEPQLRALFGGAEFVNGGPGAVRSVVELARRIAVDRPQGVVQAEAEFEFGIVELAVPLRDRSGGIAAALGVYAPAVALRGRRKEMIARLRAAAASLDGGLELPG